jgi:hypothetical protein
VAAAAAPGGHLPRGEYPVSPIFPRHTISRLPPIGAGRRRPALLTSGGWRGARGVARRSRGRAAPDCPAMARDGQPGRDAPGSDASPPRRRGACIAGRNGSATVRWATKKAPGGVERSKYCLALRASPFHSGTAPRRTPPVPRPATGAREYPHRPPLPPARGSTIWRWCVSRPGSGWDRVGPHRSEARVLRRARGSGRRRWRGRCKNERQRAAKAGLMPALGGDRKRVWPLGPLG